LELPCKRPDTGDKLAGCGLLVVGEAEEEAGVVASAVEVTIEGGNADATGDAAFGGEEALGVVVVSDAVTDEPDRGEDSVAAATTNEVPRLGHDVDEGLLRDSTSRGDPDRGEVIGRGDVATRGEESDGGMDASDTVDVSGGEADRAVGGSGGEVLRFEERGEINTP
jgi:hypothetical protein